jgi:integrase
LDELTLKVARNWLRPKYVNGCGDLPCERKAGFCLQKVNKRRETGEVKSRAGKRPMGVPLQLVDLLREQREVQDKERITAGNLWQEGGDIFITLTGRPLEWKELLRLAGVREGRLHDALPR